MGFVNKSFNDIMTFTRNSTATYIDPTGKIRTVGVNEPRFTFDPETGEPLGLLIEEQRTNLLTGSHLTLSGGNLPNDWTWFQSGGSVSNILEHPASNINFVDINTTGTERRVGSQSFTATAGVTYTVSLYIKSVIGIAGISAGARSVFRIQSTTTGEQVLQASQFNGAGYYTFTITPTATELVSVRFGIGVAAAPTEGGRVICGLPQAEAGSTRSSFIRTEASAVTRLADNVSRTLGAEFNPNEGTLYLEFEARFISTTTRTVAAIEVTTNDRISLYTDTLGRIFSRIRTGGVSYDTGILNYQIGNNKVCLTFKNGQIARMFLNGLESTGLTPVVMPNLSGQALNLSGVSVGNQWNMGGKKDFRYYPRALSQAEAQSLTKI